MSVISAKHKYLVQQYTHMYSRSWFNTHHGLEQVHTDLIK